MKVALIRCPDTSEDLLNAVHNELGNSPGPITFEVEATPMELPAGKLQFQHFFKAFKGQRASMALPDDDFLALVTDRPNEENWFAAFDDKERNLFVHADDWDYYVTCPPETAIAYEVVVNVLQRLTFGTLQKTADWAHERSIGCVNDMCGWKHDISLKIRTADICPDCLPQCHEYLGKKATEQVLELFERLRQKAKFSGVLESRTHETLPFPVAFTKRKLGMTVEPLKTFLCQLDHFDSLLRTTTHLVGRMLLGDSFKSFAEEREIHERPALGHWLGAVQALSKKDFRNILPEMALPDDLNETLQSVHRKATDDDIVEIRNARRGHGYVDLQNDAYKEDFIACQPAVQHLESLLRPILESVTLLYVKQATLIGQGRARVIWKKLMGNHPDFIEEDHELPMNSDELPISKQVYARTSDGAWHDLHDSLLMGTCSECKLNRLLISDGAKYLDPYVGHRSRRPA